MDATPRFRLFDNRRESSNQIDEEAGRTTTNLPRRRVLTSSVAVARQRRRNRTRPGARRGLAALVPRLLASSVSRASRSRALLLLLLLAACGAGVLASARLLARASLSYSSWPSSSSLPGYLHSSGAGSANRDDDNRDDDDDDDAADRHKHRRSAVSLGPDAIPSVLLVGRGPSGLPSGLALPGGARKASSLVDATGAVLGGGDGGGETRGGGGRENSGNPYRCRNTVQGATLVADSEGRVCHRAELVVEEGDDDDVRHRPGCCAPRPSALPLLPPHDGGGGGEGGDGGDLAASFPPAADDKHKHPTAAPRSVPTTTRTETRRREEGGAGVELVALAHGGGGGGGGLPPEEALSTPFSCWSCDVEEDGSSGNNGGGNDSSSFSSCCSSYEFCVSCCQNPQRGKEREAIQASAALSGHPAYRDLLGPGNKDAAKRREPPSPRQLRASAAAAEAGVEKKQQKEAEERDARELAFAHCAFRCRTYSGSVVHENSYRSALKHCFGMFRPPAASAAASALPEGRAGVVEGRKSRGAPPLQFDPLLFDLAEP